MRPAVLVLGLGNPILSDDAVGPIVARAVHALLPPGSADLIEASLGGVELLTVLEGFQEAVIVDSVAPGTLPPGEMAEIPMSALASRYAPLTPHNAGLQHCLRLGRLVGMTMPETVRIFAIGVRDPYTFGERLSPDVAAAVSGIARSIATRLLSGSGLPANQEG